jgi:ferric-dicitrate binding protein FerR (iron transport regulator)
MKPFIRSTLWAGAALLALGLVPGASRGQEEEHRFRAVEAKGMVTAYHDENDETSRLYQSQTVDDGDKVTTGPDSDAVLRLEGKAYLYLAPRTKIRITRLRVGDKGLQCEINLVTGRMFCQLDPIPTWPFTVSAGSVLCRAHGTLFEFLRKEEAFKIVAYEGAVVADFHGQTKMAKANEVIQLDHGKFRYRNHHLKMDEQGDLQAWQDLLSKLEEKTPLPSH